MPCYDGRGEEGETKRRLDRVTDLLCALCRELDQQGQEVFLENTPGVWDWWQEHRDFDKRRGE